MNSPAGLSEPGILAIVSDCYGSQGGIARYNQDLLEALAGAGSEIIIAPRVGTAPPREHPSNIRQLPARFNRLSYIWAVAIAAVRFGNLDVVFCGHIGMMPVAWAIAHWRGARLWLQIHGIEAWSRRTGWRRWCIEQADLVTSVSRCTRRRFLGWAAIPPDRVRVLPNTVRDSFSPGMRPHYLASRHGVEGRRVLLTVGRLDSKERSKGHEQVIGLFPRLLTRIPDLVYLIVGSGDDRQRLEGIVERAGLPDGVIKFLGFIPDDELPDYYRLADVFILASTAEGFGIVSVEAARTGLAVIGSRIDGSVDALRDGMVGQLVDPNGSNDIERAIVAAFNDRRRHPEAASVFERSKFVEQARNLLKLVKESSHIDVLSM